MNDTQKQIEVELDEETLALLEAAAEFRGVTLQDILREATDQYLGLEEIRQTIAAAKKD